MKVSNNSLVVLLFVAIIASVGGTFVSVSFMDDIITGAATTLGNVTLTIGGTANCNATDDLIAFGTMTQGATNQTTGDTGAYDWITIENTGNVNLDITAETSADLFASYAAPTAYWRIFCNTTQGGGTCNATVHNLQESSNATELITGHVFADSTDEVYIGMNITIPMDEPVGAKHGDILFTCTEAA
jgi:hypothetical protein